MLLESPQGIVATGGVISDYTVSNTVYRAHIFTASGTFDVSSLSIFLVYRIALNLFKLLVEAAVPLVVVVQEDFTQRIQMSQHPLEHPNYSISTNLPSCYWCWWKSGGSATTDARGANGGNTVFNSVTLQGGGGSGIPQNDSLGPGLSGGSGGGGSANEQVLMKTWRCWCIPGSPNPSPFRQGYPGGSNDNASIYIYGGGGGGASGW